MASFYEQMKKEHKNLLCADLRQGKGCIFVEALCKYINLSYKDNVMFAIDENKDEWYFCKVKETRSTYFLNKLGNSKNLVITNKLILKYLFEGFGRKDDTVLYFKVEKPKIIYKGNLLYKIILVASEKQKRIVL